MSIPKSRQVNLQPGLRKLAMELEGAVTTKRLDELRGMIRVLDGLKVYLHGDYEGDEEVLHKELDHLARDVQARQPSQVRADLAMMMHTMLNMAGDNVVAVSRVDCARVFAGALSCAEEIVNMPKPLKSYLDEARGIVHCVCQLMHADSYFPQEDLQLVDGLQVLLKKCDGKSIHKLRAHLEKVE